MKYILAMLFLGEIDTHCKRQNVFSDPRKITRIFNKVLNINSRGSMPVKIHY